MIFSRGISISKNYSLEINLLYNCRKFKDGISFIEFDVNLDLYRGSHNPKFNIHLIILNYCLFDISIFNIHHI